MKTTSILIVVIAVTFIVPVMCQNNQASQQTTQTKVSYVCPMHPEETSDKPANCSKCGMALVKRTTTAIQKPADVQQKQTPQDKIAKAKGLLKEAKDELMDAEKYGCCIKEPCNICALQHQSCSCYKDLKAGKPVCNECYAGWQRGDGVDTSIKKSQVKTSYHKHSH